MLYVDYDPIMLAHARALLTSNDMDLLEPGMVRVEEWRPGPGRGKAGRSALWCAVGRKR